MPNLPRCDGRGQKVALWTRLPPRMSGGNEQVGAKLSPCLPYQLPFVSMPCSSSAKHRKAQTGGGFGRAVT